MSLFYLILLFTSSMASPESSCSFATAFDEVSSTEQTIFFMDSVPKVKHYLLNEKGFHLLSSKVQNLTLPKTQIYNLAETALFVEYVNGPLPQIGDQFTLFSGQYKGVFKQINLPGDNTHWTIQYNDNSVILKLTSQILNINNVGIGTNNPLTKLHIAAGDVFVDNIGSSIIFKVSDAPEKCFKLMINNTGQMNTVLISCPQ